jgi:hypothetical protein
MPVTVPPLHRVATDHPRRMPPLITTMMSSMMIIIIIVPAVTVLMPTPMRATVTCGIVCKFCCADMYAIANV